MYELPTPLFISWNFVSFSMQKILLSLTGLYFALSVFAQSTWIKQDLTGLELQFLQIESGQFSLISQPGYPEIHADSLPEAFSRSKFSRKIFYDHLIFSQKKDHSVFIDPALNFQYMKTSGGSGYINTRGFHLSGNLKNRIFFTSSFFENQGRFPGYMNDFARKYAVLPGYSRMKPYNETDWDYASALGSLWFNAGEHLSFRLGHDKLFIGSGHRSLFLSDASFQQFFLQATAELGNFRFSNISMQWINPNFNNLMQSEEAANTEGNYERKLNSINLLEFSPNEHWHFTFIEAVVFQTENGHSPFAVQMINPFIVSRSFMTGFNGKDNLLCGLDIQYQSGNQIIYSQFVLDDWSINDPSFGNPENRYAYQVGYLRKDLIFKNLNLRIEHNYVKALCYAHENPEISYTHYNQNSTHPLGSNFAEVMLQMQYRIRRMPVQLQINYFQYGTDSTLSESLAPAEFNFESAYISGESSNILFADAEIGWYINPAWYLLAYAGTSYHMAASGNELWIRFGLRTNLGRQIRDF